ncbi:hypothetical protein [Mycobacterium marseillense]|uniref:Uncharacterized protein n=1 Tax=Mycobacterium marseillense TaxID=701042 RepID=A0AAC9VT98_9MYCO|nr:hypothetical protein [Mycobacterium marseillense]ASW89585.1 hypothetical protein CKJ54_06560 [Mycobacterium marseillense]
MEGINVYGPWQPKTFAAPLPRSEALQRSKSATELSIEAGIAIAALKKALGKSSETFTRSRQIIGHRSSCDCEDCMEFRFGWGRDEPFGAVGF